MSQVMDIKLKKADVRFQKRREFFAWVSGLKEELKKVSWTTKSELAFCTKIVLGFTFLFGLGIYLVDLGIKGILELVKWVFLTLLA